MALQEVDVPTQLTATIKIVWTLLFQVLNVLTAVGLQPRKLETLVPSNQTGNIKVLGQDQIVKEATKDYGVYG